MFPRHVVSPLICGLLMLSISACGKDENKSTPTDMNTPQDMPDMVVVVDISPDVDATMLDASPDLDSQDASADMVDADMAPSIPGARLLFDPMSEEFFHTPFPSDTRRDAEGKPVFSSWEVAYKNSILELWFDAAEELVDGFSVNSGFFLTFDAPLDLETIPSLASSIDTSEQWPSVFLMDVDADSPERGRLFPIDCKLNTVGGRLRVANQLGCVPPWGVLRRPETTYAMVVRNTLLAEDGSPVETSQAMQELLSGSDVEGRLTTIAAQPYTDALAYLGEQGVDTSSVVALDLFTTYDPTKRLQKVHEFYDALPEPQLNADPGLRFVLDYGDYIVVEGFYDVPIIQTGNMPYDRPPEGKIAFDDNGNVSQVDTQTIRFYLTLPRTPMGADGYPVLMYLHGSGGVSQQLMQRGAYGSDGTPPESGSGPARVVAPYGIAGFAADFQLHGMRFNPPDTSGLKLYNLFGNPRATVDNFLVAANEVTLHARLLKGLVVDPSSISNLPEGVLDLSASADGMIRFDDSAFVTMGQSMGSTIGLPAATIDSVTDGAILSGSGGSLVEIASTSTEPINVRGLLRMFLQYKAAEVLDQHDPVLHVIQHVWDIVDPLSYSPHLFQNPYPNIPPKHILQHSGLHDGYFSPASRAGLSAAMGVQLVSPVFEPEAVEIMKLVGLDDVLMPPASANADSGVTAVVRQYEPSVLDGHHVAYQRDDAKAQYACFIKMLALYGVPTLASVDQSSVENCQ